jgi:hypothetical protein
LEKVPTTTLILSTGVQGQKPKNPAPLPPHCWRKLFSSRFSHSVRAMRNGKIAHNPPSKKRKPSAILILAICRLRQILDIRRDTSWKHFANCVEARHAWPGIVSIGHAVLSCQKCHLAMYQKTSKVGWGGGWCRGQVSAMASLHPTKQRPGTRLKSRKVPLTHWKMNNALHVGCLTPNHYLVQISVQCFHGNFFVNFIRNNKLGSSQPNAYHAAAYHDGETLATANRRILTIFKDQGAQLV